MATRWRSLHKRQKRKAHLAVGGCEVWYPSGWESIYAQDYEDNDNFPDLDEWDDGENNGHCFWCAGDGVVDASEEDPVN